MSKGQRDPIQKEAVEMPSMLKACYFAHGPVDEPALTAGTLFKEKDLLNRLERRWWIYQHGLNGVSEEKAIDLWNQHDLKRTLAAKAALLNASDKPKFLRGYAHTVDHLNKGTTEILDRTSLAVTIAYRAAACTNGDEDYELWAAKIRFAPEKRKPTFSEFWIDWTKIINHESPDFHNIEKQSIRRTADSIGLIFAPGKQGRPSKKKR